MSQTFLSKSYTIRAVHKLETGLSKQHKPGEERLHGHEYKVDVTVIGSIDPNSGLIVDRDLMDKVVNEKIVQIYDKSNLNKHFKFTSGECLADEFFKILKDSEISEQLIQVKLRETRKNSFLSRLSN